MASFQEDFLHFIWQYQYFDKYDLLSTEGQEINILHPGYRQTDAGPDFSHGRVVVGPMEWHGPVEIHHLSSDWYRHHHEQDEAYDQVVLHVVWRHDREVTRKDGSTIPVLELCGRVDLQLVHKYKHLLDQPGEIACADRGWPEETLPIHQMLDVTLADRLQQKSRKISITYTLQKADWEVTTWQALCTAFGFKINQEGMRLLAKAVPLKVLLKHAYSLVQTEALLFGLSGLLPTEPVDDYCRRLQEEFAFLAHKYSLSDKVLPATVWKFMRLRPANFPTLRIAQLAAMVHKHQHLFSLFRDSQSVLEMLEALRQKPSLYWQEHYQFGKKPAQVSKGGFVPAMGKASAENILINTAVPLLFAYGRDTDQQLYMDRATTLLAQLPPEHNFIMDKYAPLGLKPANAADSQAMIQLYREYCHPRQCLRCRIGAQWLGNRENEVQEASAVYTDDLFIFDRKEQAESI